MNHNVSLLKLIIYSLLMSIFLLNVWQQITVLNTILLSYWLRAVLKIFIVFFVLLSHFIQNLWRFLHTGCLPEKTSSKPSQTLHIPKTEMSQMTPLIDCANLWQLYTLYCKSSLRWNYVREHTSSSISKVTRNCYIVEILFLKPTWMPLASTSPCRRAW